MLDRQLRATGRSHPSDARYYGDLRTLTTLWLGSGSAKREWALIDTNGTCLVLAAFILTMTIASARQKDAIADAVEPKAAK